MLARMLGAIRLDVDTYEDVEDDRSATWQALGVVILVSLCTFVGDLLTPVFATSEEEFDIVGSLVVGLGLGLVGWAFWALVTWLVGGFLLKTPDTVADWGQLARGTGFAQTAGVLNLFLFVPAVGGLIALVALIWRIVCMVIAVRQCLDYTSTWRAIFVIVISAIPWLILMGLTISVLGLGAGLVG